MTGLEFRSRVLSAIQPTWVDETMRMAQACERRRASARYNTGTISVAAALYLRALVSVLQPANIAEVGTFIGTSALAMDAGHRPAFIYTCDKSNDCGQLGGRIVAHPYTSSAEMFDQIARRGIPIDFFFLDGRIQPEDLPLILQVSTERAVYAVDDFEGNEKGVINVQRLLPWLHPKKVYTLIPPPAEVPGVAGQTTIALMVPGALL